jgi:hypothetical protein
MMAEKSKKKPDDAVLKIGFDLGTNTSVVQLEDGAPVPETDIIPTVVGYPKAGMLPGILPRGKDKVYGDEAIGHRVHVRLVWPLRKGTVVDARCVRDFVEHVRGVVDPAGAKEIWAVMGAPVNAGPEDLRALRGAVAEIFTKVLVIPEPFLAAMGYRQDERVGQAGYEDPTRHSLFVDGGRAGEHSEGRERHRRGAGRGDPPDLPGRAAGADDGDEAQGEALVRGRAEVADRGARARGREAAAHRHHAADPGSL